MNRYFGSASLVGLAGLMLAATPALAEQSQGGATELGELVVTAQKRAEKIQDVAASISAADENVIATRRIEGTQQLDRLSPSLNTTRTRNVVNINIRGLGYEGQSPSVDPSVLVYVDGVYQARPLASNMSFDDLERIEVLRGPQGTLYGRNATGGVVSFYTQNPGEEFRANANVRYGRYNEFRFGAGVEGQIFANTTARLSFLHQSRDGDMINLFNNTKVNDAEQNSGRLTIVSNLRPDVTLTVRAAYSDEKNKSLAYDATACIPSANSLGISPCEPLGSRVPAATAAALLAAFPKVFGIPDNPAVNHPNDGRRLYFSDELTGSRRHVRQYSGSATLDWTINPNLRFKSITAYQRFASDVAGNLTASTIQTVQFRHFDERSSAFTQEFTLNGDFDNGSSWVIGAYYFEEEQPDFYAGPFALEANIAVLGKSLPDAIAAVRATQVFRGQDNLIHNNIHDDNSTSIFAQGTAPLNDRLRLTAGVRVNYEERKMTDFDVDFGRVACPGKVTKKHFSNTTWKIGADYDVSEDSMIYVTASSGFKSGGVNHGSCGSTFPPETITAYEIGSKNVFLDGRLLLNAAVFRYDYQNQQLPVLDGLIVRVTSASNELQGAELEMVARPIEHLTISANGSYLHTRISNFVTANPLFRFAPGGNVAVDQKGNKLPHAPKWLLSGAVDYDLPVNGSDEIRLHYGVRHNSGSFSDPYNSAILYNKSYTLQDVRASYVRGNYEIGGFVENLGDELYGNRIANTSAGTIAIVWAPRRTWGIYAKAAW